MTGAGVHLHFSLGPVQGFVNEARRARDLWAGSFLLSWLAMKALLAIENKRGTIVSPRGLDQNPGWQALKARDGRAEPYHATVPNRLVAAFADEAKARAGARAAGEAIAAAWQDLAEAVRADFLEDVLDEDDTPRAIWDKEIGSGSGQAGPLWEIQWVVVADGVDGEAALERRKLWRDFTPFPDEIAAGDRCRLMSDWRELSGASRVTSDGHKKQKAFWKRVHEAYCTRVDEDDGGRRLELREDERLSAPALVKRLFPRLPVHHLTRVIGWAPSEGATWKGRWRPSYMPSTAYMAAAHWLARAAGLNEAQRLCNQIAVLVKSDSLALALAERETRLAIHGDPASRNPLCNIDGSLFFAETVENARELGLSSETCARLAELLRGLYATPDPADEERPLGAPSPYYAILRMDGDNMGELLGKEPKLAEALSAFAPAARPIVEARSGRLIYAGADDLLALLPLEEAIAAALALEAKFAELTAAEGCPATISAGLVFAHQNAPLRAAMAESQRLLDDIAKEVNGRASLAVSVFRVGGAAFEWATTWRKRAGGEPVRAVQGLLDRLYDPARPTRTLAGNRLSYAMRDRLGPFFTEPGARRKAILDADKNIVPRDAVKALVRSAGGEAMKAVDDADLDAFLDAAMIRYRKKDDDGRHGEVIESCTVELCLDFVRLFRFLGSQWRKRLKR